MEQWNLFGNNVKVVVDEKDLKYSMKAKCPIYTPKEGVAVLGSCYDVTKFNMLCGEIDKSDISERDKRFLKLAATRHIVFNYENIADYYAQSSKKIQDLMEKSALVIIDFDSAIKYGYVDLNKKMRDLYELEVCNGDE